MARKGWMATSPLAGTCPYCDELLGLEPLTKRKGVWVHRVCLQREQR